MGKEGLCCRVNETEKSAADARKRKASPLHLLGDFLFYVALYVFGLIWRRDRYCILGSAIALPSFVLWFIAKLQLGSSFSLKAEARTLVTDGLYSRVRHPIYLFSTLAMIGIAICLRLWFFYAYVGLGVAAQLWRIRREERVLAKTFGEAYRNYRKDTWF